MAGYTRQSTYTDGDVIDAADSNDEFDQVLAAFNNSSGHKHDGTAAEGPVIGLIGDPGITTPLNKVVVDNTNNRVGVFVDAGGLGSTVEQVRFQDGVIVPVTNNDIDLGTSGAKFKDLHLAGDANIAGTMTLSGNVIVSGTLGADLIPDADNTRDIGSGAAEWKDLYLDGVAYLDSIAMPTTTVTDILDEDNLVSDSATALATQQSIKAYVDAQVTAQDFDYQGDTGGAQSIDLDSQSMTFTGGTGIDTTGSAQTMTFAIDSTVATLADTQTFTNKTLTTPVLTTPTITNAILNTGISGTAFLDEDNMASDSATKVASQQSIKAYVDAQVTAQDLDFSGDSGGAQNVDLDSQSLTFTGGTGIDTTGSAQTISFAIDSTVATLADTQTFTNKTLTSAVLNGTISGTSIKDEDNMASDSATHLATQQSIKAYVDAEVAAIPVGDITSVVAGTGMTGGGTSGDVTLNVIGGAGITANANDIAVDSTVITGQTTEATIDAANDFVLVYDNSATALRKATVSAITSAGSGINAVVDDTSPQLGGDLDVNGNDIVSTSNANIDILPNGTGVVNLDGNGSSGGVSISDGLVDIRTGTGTRSQVKFYCESSNAHAQTVQPQPHSASVTNTLTLPAGGNQEIVGTTATQTLTNKSIVATQLTGTIANARLDAQLQDVAGLAVTDGGFIVGDGSNFVLETAGTARTSLGLGTAAVLNTGTSAGNAIVLDGSARLPGVDGSQLTNLPSTGATAGFAVAMAIAL